MRLIWKYIFGFLCLGIITLAFQNCGVDSSGGRAQSVNRSSLGNFRVDISEIRTKPGSLLGCEIDYIATHPAGVLSIKVFAGDSQFGSLSVNDGNETAENGASGTLDCETIATFDLIPGRETDISLELTLNEDTVSERSNIEVLSLAPLVELAINKKYRNQNHSVYLFDDFSHCKYLKFDAEIGIPATDADFQTIIGFKSGGVCNGDYPGSGAEPPDWTYGQAGAVLATDQAYRYDGTNVMFDGTRLCLMSDNSANLNGLINADASPNTDPVKIELKVLIIEAYNSNLQCP